MNTQTQTQIQTIKKQVHINAPKENVWNVLVQDKFNSIWYEEFCPGTHAQTDWKEGSKVVFTNTSGEGIAGKIIESKPGEALSIEFTGFVKGGMEDYESEEAQKVKDTHESYVLTETNGATLLHIESDMPPEHFEAMSQAWDRALQKIKSLAE